MYAYDDSDIFYMYVYLKNKKFYPSLHRFFVEVRMQPFPWAIKLDLAIIGRLRLFKTFIVNIMQRKFYFPTS